MSAQPTSWLQNLGIAVEVLCPTLSLIVVSLRIYSRLRIDNFGLDDGLIILAMFLSIAMAVGSIICIKELYIGIHYYDVPKDANFSQGLVWTYVVGAIYNPILAIVKQSVLHFLLRLAGTKPGVRTVVLVTAVLNAALMVAVFFAVIFQSNPIAANWDLTVKGKCINQVAFGISTAGITIFTDLVALGLPFYVFLDLQIKKKAKIALNFVFLLGIIVTAVSIIRLWTLWAHFTDTSPDANFSFGFSVSSIECNLAIITASGPALWPLVRTWVPRLVASTSYRQGYYERHPGDGHERTGGGGGDTSAGVWTPDSSQKQKRSAYANAISGGSVIKSVYALKDMEGSGRGTRRLDIRSQSHGGDTYQDSDEEMLTQNPGVIIRTTDFTITHDQEAAQKTRSPAQGGNGFP